MGNLTRCRAADVSLKQILWVDFGKSIVVIITINIEIMGIMVILITVAVVVRRTLLCQWLH